MSDVELAKSEFGEILFEVDVELGRKLVKVRELLNWEKGGTILKFTKTSGEPVDFFWLTASRWLSER